MDSKAGAYLSRENLIENEALLSSDSHRTRNPTVTKTWKSDMTDRRSSSTSLDMNVHHSDGYNEDDIEVDGDDEMDGEEGEEEEEGKVIDMDRDGMVLLVAAGGKGGMGNKALSSANNRRKRSLVSGYILNSHQGRDRLLTTSHVRCESTHCLSNMEPYSLTRLLITLIGSGYSQQMHS